MRSDFIPSRSSQQLMRQLIKTNQDMMMDKLVNLHEREVALLHERDLGELKFTKAESSYSDSFKSSLTKQNLAQVTRSTVS